jgi:hypothetical protein
MSGIEIINTYEQVVEREGTMIGFWIGLLITIALCIIFITYKIKQGLIKEKRIDYQFLYHTVIMSFIISLFCGGLGLLIKTKPAEYENIYEVTVSEEVTFNEFIENYDIIEIKEDTYLVRDKF